MVKVFSTNYGADAAGDELTRQFEEWKSGLEPYTIEVLNMHSTSNEWGWMLTIVYKIIR